MHLWMYTCVFMCTWMCMCFCTCACVFVRLYAYAYVCMYVCMYTCIHFCVIQLLCGFPAAGELRPLTAAHHRHWTRRHSPPTPSPCPSSPTTRYWHRYASAACAWTHALSPICACAYPSLSVYINARLCGCTQVLPGFCVVLKGADIHPRPRVTHM
jgi:hypothetical protein